jgi:flagellar basal-body rod modification protein FlgD
MTTVSTAATATAPKTTVTGRQGSLINGDLETFLRLLTTQMRNQDPLNPMESSEFAVQLATFSGVEQQVRTNQLLESLASQKSLSGLAELAGWVGMEARVAAPVQFTGTPVSLSPAPDQGADQAVLVTYDAQNREVKREAVSLTATSLTWVGTDGAGAVLPTAAYSFKLESFRAGTLMSSKPVEAYATVTEVRNSATGALVVLDSGAMVPAASVSALR